VFKKLSFSILAIALFSTPLLAYAQGVRTTAQVIDDHAEHIFYASAARGMALVVINNDQQEFRGLGESSANSDESPRPDSLIRIASLTKLMTSEVMVKLAQQGVINMNDPLAKYAPPNSLVPAYDRALPITLLNLATHTSGLPREQPGGVESRDVFTWPTHNERWHWLSSYVLQSPPGSRASYSNLGYDLLADALAMAANKPYYLLLHDLITTPLGMPDTTFSPTEAQCSRLMVGVNASPCVDTNAAAGSGGLYSTPADMAQWMQQFLTISGVQRSPAAIDAQKMYYHRSDLVSVKGMDVAGKADELGLGWVHIDATATQPAIYEKTGGGGGFITYIATVPQQGIGVFIAVTRTDLTEFKNMSQGVNELIADLVHNNEMPSMAH
jgi:D-alanyl-D-alanine-carboxypeptidase/D-alanyl-D-alanine-endopeptidase